jgi:anti-sigma factor RsiW
VPESQLIRLLGGELSVAEREMVVEHLGECSKCRDAWEELRSTWDLLGRSPTTPPARDLTGAVLAQVAALQAGRRRWASVARVAAVIALASGVGIMAGIWASPRPTVAQAPPVTDEQLVATLGLDAVDEGADLFAALFEPEEWDETEASAQEQPS